jgi:hypothetical protein
MRLAKCPLCKEHPRKIANEKHIAKDIRGKAWCTNWRCPLLKAPFIPAQWNRLARLVRKGRMFEWLERMAPPVADGVPFGCYNEAVYAARDWWRKRRKEREYPLKGGRSNDK